jgi:hypothetical protein
LHLTSGSFSISFSCWYHMYKSNVLHSYAPTHTSFKIASPKCPSAALHAIKWSMLLLQCSCCWDNFLSHILPCTWHIKLQIQLSIYHDNAYLQQLESLWAHKAGWTPLTKIRIWGLKLWCRMCRCYSKRWSVLGWFKVLRFSSSACNPYDTCGAQNHWAAAAKSWKPWLQTLLAQCPCFGKSAAEAECG